MASIAKLLQNQKPLDEINVANGVASYVAGRLVEALGRPPHDGRGGRCKLGHLQIVLLIDEAGGHAEIAQQLALASISQASKSLDPRNAG